MAYTTNTTLPCTPVTLLDQTPASFRPGDVVVIDGRQPAICTVLEEGFDGRIRLSLAACPEVHMLADTADVKHLSVWLTSEISADPRRLSGRC